MIDENNIDDFEQFLRNQADKHRMYPSDQIWRNINQQLHGKSRWPALTFAAILTGTLLTAGLIFLHPEKNLFKLPSVAATEPTVVNPIAATEKNLQKPATVNIIPLQPVNEKTAIYTFNTPAFVAPVGNFAYGSSTIVTIEAVNTPILTGPLKNENISAALVSTNLTEIDKNVQLYEEPRPASATTINSEMVAANGIIDNDEETKTENEAATHIFDNGATSNGNDIGNELPEYLLTRLKAIGIKKIAKRFSINIYGGSNISYRRLSESASYDYHFPYNAAITADPRKNLNNLVSQRAAIGFEFGTAIAYAITDRVKIKAGLQFNLRQYNIDAYKAGLEQAVLLINNSATLTTDSVLVYSSIRNSDGGKPITLQNRYFQIGLPVGIDWTFAEGRKVNFSLGASLQPTYQLNTNIYMITSDYKSYVQQPDMVRRWNLNAGVEAMANFNAGGLKWQVGPQFRYQMSPTQAKSFSVHEHLIDYGVKVGIIKQLK